MGAAVCEVNGCGVLAVGRCIGCSKAFCRSHQDVRNGFETTNLCSPCRSRRDQPAPFDPIEHEAAVQRHAAAVQTRLEMLSRFGSLGTIPIGHGQHCWLLGSYDFPQKETQYQGSIGANRYGITGSGSLVGISRFNGNGEYGVIANPAVPTWKVIPDLDALLSKLERDPMSVEIDAHMYRYRWVAAGVDPDEMKRLEKLKAQLTEILPRSARDDSHLSARQRRKVEKLRQRIRGRERLLGLPILDGEAVRQHGSGGSQPR